MNLERLERYGKIALVVASVVFSLVFGTRPVAMTAARHCHESRETNSPRAGAVEGHGRARWRAMGARKKRERAV